MAFLCKLATFQKGFIKRTYSFNIINVSGTILHLAMIKNTRLIMTNIELLNEERTTSVEIIIIRFLNKIPGSGPFYC